MIVGILCLLLAIIGLTLVCRAAQRLTVDDEDDKGVFYAIMGGSTLFVVFIIFISYLGHIAHNPDIDIYFDDIKAQCESIGGTFNQNREKPACYLNGERIEK